MNPFQERVQVTVDGGNLAVWRSGPEPGSGAPVVIAVHGITANHVSWAPVARALGNDVCLLAPDLRGRGDSATVAGGYGMRAHAADIRAVLDLARASSVIVMGHSMGAFVAAMVANGDPGRVRALLAVDGGVPFEVPDGTDPQKFLAAVLGPALVRLTQTFASREQYHSFWRAHPAFADIDDADLVAYADHDLAGRPPLLHPRALEAAVRADGAELVVDVEVCAALGNVRQPLVLLRATRGLRNEPVPMISPAQAAAVVAAAPARRSSIVVDSVNHYSITMGARGAAAVHDALRSLIRQPDPTA